MNALQQALDRHIEEADVQSVKKSSQQLSVDYCEGLSLTVEHTLLDCLTVRMPATYVTLTHVLSNLPNPRSILDLTLVKQHFKH